MITSHGNVKNKPKIETVTRTFTGRIIANLFIYFEAMLNNEENFALFSY